MSNEILAVIVAVVGAVCVIAAFVGPRASAKKTVREIEKLLSGAGSDGALQQKVADLAQEISRSRSETLNGVQSGIANLSKMLLDAQTRTAEEQSKLLAQRQESLEKSVNTAVSGLDERMKTMALQNEQKLENIRTTLAQSVSKMNEENAKKLDQMRETVDEKLQKTLNERLGQSFQQVSEQLDLVKTGLGEMRTLATGVGDLKKVLSNVKTRGNIGEIQLGAILDEILAPEQYAKNVATKPGSSDRVEFAVKMPTESGETVYIPIDSKFPGDTYASLQDAYEAADADGIKEAQKRLGTVVKKEAKDIRDKYISPPDTTEFAIMFLPFEGLYAEVVRMGLIEELQRDFRVNVAGPSTMAALLNSLQMGFRAFAINKRSGEVWKVLGEVKNEFGNFEKVLTSAQNRIGQVGNELEKLVGTRTRAINRKLRSVEALDSSGNDELLLIDGDE
ncbi:MAG: DNA recombination protein RmuC [Clostridia bacterium]|nr:DNA recombination protein RmuC [Clostridia bacterium]